MSCDYEIFHYTRIEVIKFTINILRHWFRLFEQADVVLIVSLDFRKLQTNPVLVLFELVISQELPLRV